MSNKAIPAPLLPLAAALSWGAMFPIAAHAFADVDPFNITAIRYAVASLIFVGLLAWREGRGAFALEGRGWLLFGLGSLGFAGFNLFSYVGLSHTEPQNAAIVIPMLPLVTVLLRWGLDGIRPDPRLLGVIGVALAGVVLVVTGGSLSGLQGGTGDLLVFAGMLCWALYTRSAARFGGWSPLRYTTLTAGLGTVTVVTATAVADVAGWQTLPGPGDVGGALPEIAFIVLFGAVLAVVAWNAGVQRLGAPTASLFITMVPVTTFVIRIAEGYSPRAAEFVGTGLVITSLLAASLLMRRAETAKIRVGRAEGHIAGPTRPAVASGR